MVKIPTAVLLRHQTALQAVGKLCYDRLQVRQLLVEIGAQAVELFFVGQFDRGDRLVIFDRPDFVIALRQMVPIAALRGNGLHAVIAHFAIGAVLIVHVFAVIIGFGLFAFALLRLGAGFCLASFTFALVFAVAVLVLAVIGVITTFVGIGRIHIAFGEVQMLQHRLRQRGKVPLIIQCKRKCIKVATGIFLNPTTQHVDPSGCARGDGQACEALAHDQRQCCGDRHFVGGLGAADRVSAQF